ncbi:hypothetical protein G6M26_23390 [Agrobacterium tumefaciens]|nr:hypothetical protein [Agrobacterium tumefaciens]NTE21488.1 hypothetical protein [Agrobacterium tumefaciens]
MISTPLDLQPLSDLVETVTLGNMKTQKKLDEFRSFAISFVQPLLPNLDIENDFIEISTLYEGSRVIFKVGGIKIDGEIKWEVAEIFEPRDQENYKIITHIQ